MFGYMMWNDYVGRGVMLLASTLLLAALARTDNDDNLSSLQSPTKLEVGRSLDITKRFGSLMFSMTVLPYGVKDSMVCTEPTFSVFEDVNCFNADPEHHMRNLSDRDIQIDFCDNIMQLMQAYFKDYSIERVEQPWRVFAGSWKPKWTGKNLGLKFSAMENSSYVLVRIFKYIESKRILTLPDNIRLKEGVSETINNITIGDSKSVTDFIEKYGSHYISSYSRGNSVFQVFAYNFSVYSDMRDNVKARGISNIPQPKLKAFFSPFNAKYIGPVKVANDNPDVTSWVKSHLRDLDSMFTWPSILKIYDEPTLLRVLNSLLENEAVLKLELKTLSPAFKDVKKKRWFEQVLDKTLRMWSILSQESI